MVKVIKNVDVKLLRAQLFSVMKATDDHSIAKVDRSNLEGLENLLSEMVSCFKDGADAVLLERSADG